MSGSALERLRDTVDPAYRGLRRFAGRIRRRISGSQPAQAPSAITVQLPVSDPAMELFKQAHALSANGEHEKAIDILDGILRNRPSDLLILQTKGQLLAALQRHSDAVAVFEQAFKSDANNLVTLESLARLYEALKRPDDALEAWRKIALLNGCDENVARMIGNQIWERDERARNSSFWLDAEEGVPRVESVIAETDAILIDSAKPNSKDLVSALEKLSRQVAGQNSVLGRLDALYTYYEYTLMQGRFRSMALRRYTKTPIQHPDNPPASIPAAMLPEFSLNGRIEIQSAYTNSALPLECVDGFDDEAVKSFLSYNLAEIPEKTKAKAAEITHGFEPIRHSQAERAFQRKRPPDQKVDVLKALHFADHVDPSKTVAIVSESDHYLESLLITMCKRLTIVRYGNAAGGAQLFDEEALSSWTASPQKYDVIICRRSLEHWGLGRYGEPLDSYGDIKLMKAFREKLQPGGSVFFEIPVGRDRLVFNSARIFGEHRLPLLLEGWRHAGRDPVKQAQLTARVPARLGFHLYPLS